MIVGQLLHHRLHGKSKRLLAAGGGWLLTGLLSACSVGPDYQLPDIATHAHWTASTPADRQHQPPEALQAWWKSFRDPVLNRLIDDAIANNLDIATAQARLREARAARQQAIGRLLPTLNAAGSQTWQYSGTSGNGPAGGSSSPAISRSFQAGFDTSWELDLFGGNRRAAEAATYSSDAAAEQVEGALLSLVAEVAATYVEARGYQARMALSRRTAATQREMAKLTRSKAEAGSSAAVDVEKALAQALNTEADLPATETALTRSLNQLAILIAQPPGAIAPRLAHGSGRIPERATPLPAGLPADILSNRPDVRQAERQLAVATAQIGAADANRYPNISLSGNLTTSGANLVDLAHASSIGWAFGPSVSVPLFDGGALEAASDAARARRDQALVALRASVLSALGDVENALAASRNDRRRHAQLAEAASHSRAAASLTRSLYETGTASFLDTLDAERSLYAAEDALIQSRVAIATDTITLAKALGGGMTGPVDAGQPLIDDRTLLPRLATLSKLPSGFADPGNDSRRFHE
jgi:multidrug efflux system outer membrane protein